MVAGRLDERLIDGVDGIELWHSVDGSMAGGAPVDQSHRRSVVNRPWQLGPTPKFETYISEVDDPSGGWIWPGVEVSAEAVHVPARWT